MAIRIAKLASYNFMKPNIRTTFFFSRSISNNFTTRHPDDDFKICDQEYQQWCNGGGMFHKSARIDPTARIEIGALVHPESTVGAMSPLGPEALCQGVKTGTNWIQIDFSDFIFLSFLEVKNNFDFIISRIN